MHLIALIIDVHRPSSPRQRRGKARPAAPPLRMKQPDQTRLLKTSYCFEHIRGQSGQACPRLVCMIVSGSSEQKLESCSSSDPGSSGYVSSSRCLGTRRRCACRLVAVQRSIPSETCFMDKGGSRQRSTTSSPEVWWSLTGSNRRPHACKARALPTELRPHCVPLAGGPAQTCAAAAGLR